MAVIYGLFDPRTTTDLVDCRYIGQTIKSPEARLREHVTRSKWDDYPSCRWVRKLLDAGVEPMIRVLEDVENGQEEVPLALRTPDVLTYLDLNEVKWIALGKSQGCVLLNITVGGRSGDRLTGHPDLDAIRQKMSEAHKGVPLSEEHRQNLGLAHTGKPLADTTKQAISKAMTGNPKAGNGGRARKQRINEDPEFAQYISDTQSRISKEADRGNKVTARLRELLRDDPVFAEQHRKRAQTLGQTHGRANGLALSKLMRSCDECGLEGTAGNVGRHQKKSGHRGWTAISTQN